VHVNRIDGFIRRATNLGVGALRSAEKGFGDAGDAAVGYVAAGRKRARRIERKAEQMIESHSIMAVVVLALVGCLLAMMFSRRD
jgi:hypothetical protein